MLLVVKGNATKLPKINLQEHQYSIHRIVEHSVLMLGSVFASSFSIKGDGTLTNG